MFHRLIVAQLTLDRQAQASRLKAVGCRNLLFRLESCPSDVFINSAFMPSTPPRISDSRKCTCDYIGKNTIRLEANLKSDSGLTSELQDGLNGILQVGTKERFLEEPGEMFAG